MSGSIEELIVRAKPEGIDQVTNKFGQMKTSLAESKQEMQDTAGAFGDIQQRFQGALGAIVTGLAVGVAGLATQIPVLGSLMGGLNSVVQALAFQIDQVLRPALMPVTKELFNLSEQIFQLDGRAGDLVGGIAALAGAGIVLLASLGAIAAAASAVVGGLGTLAGIATTVGGAIAGVVAAIGLAATAFFVLLAAVVAFAAAYDQNWFGIRDKTNAIVGKIVDFVTNGFNTLKNKALNAVGNLKSKAVSEFNNLKSDIQTVFNNLISAAVGFGKEIIQKLIQGIQQAIPELRNEISDLPGGQVLLEGADTLGQGADLIQQETTNFVRGQTGGVNLSIDGRRLDEQTGRYSFDRAARR
jgi:hypothetical protein